MMAATLSHLHIRTENPRAAAEWLRDAFEWTIGDELVRQRGERFIRCFAGDEGHKVVITSAFENELLPSAPRERHFGLEHFGLDADDLDAVLARVVRLGARVLEGPFIGHRGNRAAFIETPFGIIVELAE